MTKHTCGFSAWMLSLPFLTFLSPIIFFISDQCHFLWKADFIRFNPIILASYDTSRLFYEHLRWLQIPGRPLTVP